MELSKKTKRLMVLATGVLVIAITIVSGAKNNPGLRKPTIPHTPYPYVPADIDPNALNMSQPVTSQPTITQTSPTNQPAPAVVVPPRPAVTAESYLVADLDSGQVYTEHDSAHVFPIASLSKLMTAVVAIHNMNINQKITITQSMLDAYGDAGEFKLGETFTLSEILYPLLLESSNDAAEAIAQTYGYSKFIALMNNLAANLGMKSTSFKDSSGLSSGNDSNAQDLFTLARYIYGNEKSLLELTRSTVYTVGTTTEHEAHAWHTINPFPLDPHFMGGKTGRTTEAKESMISMFRYPATNGKLYNVAVIVLRSDFSAREIDSSYLFSQFIRKIGG